MLPEAMSPLDEANPDTFLIIHYETSSPLLEGWNAPRFS